MWHYVSPLERGCFAPHTRARPCVQHESRRHERHQMPSSTESLTQMHASATNSLSYFLLSLSLFRFLTLHGNSFKSQRVRGRVRNSTKRCTAVAWSCWLLVEFGNFIATTHHHAAVTNIARRFAITPSTVYVWICGLFACECVFSART